MPHDYPSGFAYLPVSRAFRLRAIALGGAALERLHSYGMDDRREAVLALIVAGAVPLAGMLLLGWDPVTSLLVLLLNLLFGVFDDMMKILRGWGRRHEARQERVEDEAVWPVARAVAMGRTMIYGKTFPTDEDLAAGRSQAPAWLTMMLTVLLIGFDVFLLQGPGSYVALDRTVWLGILPTVLLGVGFSVFHAWNQHPHWRRAGSVRLQIATETSTVASIIGGGVFVWVTAQGIARDGFAADAVTVVASLAAILYGGYRLWALKELRGAAKWLERAIALGPKSPPQDAAFGGRTRGT